MVYEKKCSECGKILDFGGKEPRTLPDNAIEFDDKIYCKECVKEFVEFGTGDIMEVVSDMEDDLDRIKSELGLEKH